MAGLNLLKLVSGRQEPVASEFDVSYADLLGQSGNLLRFAFLPEGATLQSLKVAVDTAWNSVTSDTLTLKFDDGTQIIAATSIAAISRYAGVDANYGQRRSALDYLCLLWTGVGTAPTAGHLTIHYSYTMQDKSQFNHGLDGYPNTGHA